jgi:hypothetical protein
MVTVNISIERNDFDLTFHLSACQPLKLNITKTGTAKIKGMVENSNIASRTSFRRIFLKEI